ncbi:DUF3107 domain-containing protein [Candidatus Poriferisodalis sp.]|uniref:DUF3107 domain-containing protein n=1 Tax=Candidatus Poriferisodalis sp. TaxID=3101277 RepID=UPI003B0201CF
MDIRIGITHGGRELSVEIDDEAAEDAAASLEGALSGGETVLWLNDRSGRRVGVPIDKLAYLELGPAGDRRIGFAAD